MARSSDRRCRFPGARSACAALREPARHVA
jgi:hypothetical protein